MGPHTIDRLASPGNAQLDRFNSRFYLPDASVVEEWPTRTTLPLNSKRLNLLKWRVIAASLELSTDARLAETHLIVEGKLTELGHEPIGVQVILNDTDETLYLVDKEGIIKTVNLSGHVIVDESCDHDVSGCSALRKLTA